MGDGALARVEGEEFGCAECPGRGDMQNVHCPRPGGFHVAGTEAFRFPPDFRPWQRCHGEDAIGEFKTGGSDTGRTPALQTAGYAALAFRKNPERVKRYRIQLFADGKPGQVTVYKDQDDVPAFLALRTLYAWSNKKETIR